MDINGHNLPLLASLRTMLDERNITRAAVHLGISQPALSAQLARLRDVFGDQLLTPAASGKGMVLTPRGMRRPSLKDYTRLDHVIVSGDGGGFHGFIDDILHQKGLARRVGVSVQYYSVVPLILQTTDLVCTLPARFLSRYQTTLTPLR